VRCSLSGIIEHRAHQINLLPARLWLGHNKVWLWIIVKNGIMLRKSNNRCLVSDLLSGCGRYGVRLSAIELGADRRDFSAQGRSDMEKPMPGLGGSSEAFEPLLDTQQAGELMHLHPESVKRLARTGEIVTAKMGGVWRFRVSTLEAYMQKITAKTQAQIAESMAPSNPAVDVVRNWKK
jgi:excisionase family DNA binding protein